MSMLYALQCQRYSKKQKTLNTFYMLYDNLKLRIVFKIITKIFFLFLQICNIFIDEHKLVLLMNYIFNEASEGMKNGYIYGFSDGNLHGFFTWKDQRHCK